MTSPSSADWTELLVGHVLPADTNLDIVDGASTHFGNIATGFRHYEDQMRRSWSGTLTTQEGRTADAGRTAFQHGEQLARETADKYETIQCSNKSAHSSASELRSELMTIAEHGNSRIKEIQNSKGALPIKVGKITEVVADCQTQANGKAAACAGNMLTDIQNILDKHGIPTSAQQFANDSGFDTTRMFGSPNTDTIRQQVEATLNGSDASAGTRALGNPVTPGDTPNQPSGTPTPMTLVGQAPTPAPPLDDHALPHGTPTGAAVGQTPTPMPLARTPATLPEGPPATVAGQAPTPTPSPTPAPASPPVLPGPSAPAVTTGGGLPATTPAAPATPTPLMQGFSQGVQTGAPIGTNALSSPVAPMTPPLSDPPAAVAPHVAQTFPSSGHAPVFDVPAQAPVAQAPVPPPAYLPPGDAGAYIAGPAAAPTPIAGAAAPVGPLPSYGADIRPPVATTPAAPPAPANPPPAGPSSAPAAPASSNLNQPAVVRHHPTTPTPSPTPAAVSEQAVAVTAGGATAGADSADATARARLQHLVDAVARQEPRLNWAAGDRPDGSTVLVTDLACGWVPPRIDIPTGFSLLEPARRRGGVEALLGEVAATATFAPGQHLPSADEPVPTSPRARHGPAADELGWELGQATKWRDGLPRLAHTLATAACRGTGVPDDEIELLRDYLGTIGDRVIEHYPNDVDGTEVENWQLLATIAALVDGDRTEAAYHFTWFQALNRATTEERRV